MKSPKKSSKTKRAPKAPHQKNHDLDAILPYEEPIKPSDLENWSNEDSEQNSVQKDEIQEIKPKKISGWRFLLLLNSKNSICRPLIFNNVISRKTLYTIGYTHND